MAHAASRRLPISARCRGLLSVSSRARKTTSRFSFRRDQRCSIGLRSGEYGGCHDLSYRQVYRRYGRRFYTKEKKKRESLRSVVPFCPFGGTGTCHLGIGRCGRYDRYRPEYGAAIVTLPPPKTDCARTEVSVSLCVSILIPTSLHVLPCCRLRDPRCICRLPHRSSIGGSVSGVLVPLGVLRGNP